MPRQKKWIAVILCSLALLITFSVLSSGSVHAASNISHAQLKSSALLKPLPQGPDGCYSLVELTSYFKSGSYHGHSFGLSATLYGWYAELNDGTLAFCNQITCLSVIVGDDPPGNLEAYCDFSEGHVSTWIAGGKVYSLWSQEVGESCGRQAWAGAAYTPAGGTRLVVLTSPPNQDYFIPCTIG